MRKFLFASLLFSLSFTACNNYNSPTNPGGHSPEETAAKIRENAQKKQQQPQSSAAPAQTASGPADGRQLYEQNCATCHQNGANGAPPLYGVMNRRELPSGTPANDARVKDTIRMGRANMPAFGRVLDDQQIDAIVAYLHTI